MIFLERWFKSLFIRSFEFPICYYAYRTYRLKFERDKRSNQIKEVCDFLANQIW